ncbi:hypothetical protein SAY87_024716 [Trapa incisa]|uniref:non-specific serine/threonine protein kinase n=1 Tax=Trapa incisa TaxID=236973 RepID=A0AAN7JG51_9MYRT|nr:hypothetical protein SAY87_024716 [Trapa incisa]
MRQSPLGRHPSQLGAPGSGASPHMNWPQPPPPFMMNSGDMYMSSGGHSSSHGSSRRPPHPSSSAPGFAQGSFSYEDLEAATGKDRPTMDWSARMQIALGSAKGLAYLHEDCKLDSVLPKCMLSARPLIDSSLQTGNYRELIDPRLEDNFNLQEMVQMVACAGACTRHSAKRRPKMSQVVRALEGEANLEDLNAWNNKHAASTVRAGENSSGNSSEYDSSYTADMSKLGKVSANSQGYSSETGGTSD